MAIWDYLGNLQNKLTQKQTASGPYNADGRVNFGPSLDVAKNLPKNPQSYNDRAEDARQWLLKTAEENIGTATGVKNSLPLLLIPGIGTAAVGFTTATYGLAELDKKTDGRISKVMMAGTKGLRSNYAFVQDVARHNAGLGLLAGLNMLAGGVIGAVGGFAAGAVAGAGVASIPGAFAGAAAGFGLGANLAGKAGRDIAESGALGESLQKSAILSESAQGQKLYNFGTDVTRLAGEVIGLIPGETGDNNWLKDTNRGVGAAVAGIFNTGFEVIAAPDIKAAKLGGVVGRNLLTGGVASGKYGITASLLAKTKTADLLRADGIDATKDLVKRTVAGEETSLTPVYKFYQDNDVPTLLARPEFKDNQAGVIGANLFSKKSFEEMGLLTLIGIGEKSAIKELEVKHPATFAELLRQEGIFDTLDARNPFASTKLPDHDMLKGRIVDAETIIKAEITDLRKQYSELNKTLKLDSALQDRGVSRFAYIEKLRNDTTKQRSINKLEGGITDVTIRETKVGDAIQKVYQRNGNSVVVRTIQRGIAGVERGLDDAPHSTVNFNDPLQGVARVRTTMRKSINRKVLPPLEARSLFDSFVTATTEKDKLQVIKKIEERVFEQVANKYNVPASIKDLVLNYYTTLATSNKKKAVEARSEGNAFMIENGEVIKDPQLISQLANGSYLPDVELIDKAFARYAKKRGKEASLPVNTALVGKAILDEFNSIWRTFTLARTGFPINIIRDSTLRTWGDGVLLYSLFNLSKSGVDVMLGTPQKISEMRQWSNKITNRQSNLDKIRKDIKLYDNAIKDGERGLKSFKYDPLKPPKEMPDDLVRTLAYLKESKDMATELRRQENAIVQNIPSKVVGPDKYSIRDYDFPAAFSGRFGEMAMNKLQGKDDIRALVASSRQLELAAVRRDRDGGQAIRAIDNEDVHLRSWNGLLNDTLRNDEVSRKIMELRLKGVDATKIEAEVAAWIRSSGSTDLFERFGYDYNFRTQMKLSDAKVIYNKANAAINQFAPDIRLQKMIMEDRVSIVELKKMFPDITTRPDVISDLALDLTGQSLLVRAYSKLSRDVVASLATWLPSRLSYNPYYQAQYELKLQSMVAIADSQGRILKNTDKAQFESVARNYAMTQYRAKINAFNRDMNYHGLLDYVFAFFPAVVEQFRAYGRLTMERPEFPLQVFQMSQIPNQLGNVQTDQYGNEYSEVNLPILGIKARLSTDWWNAINPTGGTVLSASPALTATYNEISKSKKLPKIIHDLILPFDTQSNTAGALTPSTIRRTVQAIQATILKNGQQFNRDVDMFMAMKRKEFVDEYGVEASGTDLTQIQNESEKDAVTLSVVRALGAGILPSQPRYVSPLEKYADLLGKYINEYGGEGAEKFTNDYPELYMLADKLTDSTSGLRADDTAVNLAKKNGSAIAKMVANIDRGNLKVLGAVFNDADYAFSSSARAYLTDNNIPGTGTRFQTEADALDIATSSIVNKGWRDWNKMIKIVKQTIIDDRKDPNTGYGKTVLDMYKKNFEKQMETENNLWWNDKNGNNFASKSKNTIDVLTIAANTKELWKDLAKQPRWHSIVDYLNFRYHVKEELERRDATITSDKAVDIRMQVNVYVASLMKQDINFEDFYNRYLEGDEFNYVYKEVVKGKIK
jgi:hypothetical protein